MTVVFSYFDIEDAIKFQHLNKMMYEKKTPLMCYNIVGRKIEPEIVVYEVYSVSRNALSVVVGEYRANNDESETKAQIDEFLSRYPLFARKFRYDNFSWPCYETRGAKQKLMVAAFKFRTSDYRIRLSQN